MILLAFVLWIFFGALIISLFMGASSLDDLQRRESVRRRVVRAQTVLDSDYSI